MATFDLLGLEPHKVSRDLTGYITYIYGEPKTGKTTLASQAGTALILAYERGYNALPGVYPVDISSWSDTRAILRELKKPEVKAKFQSVVIDTIDIAGTLCEKYICAQNGVDKIGDIPYGGGWNLMKKEFEDVFRSITQLGYAVFFISHCKDKEFKRKDGSAYNQTIPSCPNSFNDIAKNMADIYAYAEKYEEGGVAKVKLVLRSIDNSADTGSRFKYIKPEIEMSYQALCDALNEAIDKEAAETNNQYVTTERAVFVEKTLDYDALMNEFNVMASALVENNSEYYVPRISFVIEKYLGKGMKMADATFAQVEMIDLVVSEIRDTLYCEINK